MSARTPEFPVRARLQTATVSEQTKALAAPLEREPGPHVSLLLFRCAGERFAVPAQEVQRVVAALPVRRVPRRAHAAFRGLVADEGEILLVGSLERLLDLGEGSTDTTTNPRMIVLGPDQRAWAFQVDMIDGVAQVAESELRPAPATLRRGLGTATRLLARIKGEPVAVLQPEALRRGWEGAAT